MTPTNANDVSKMKDAKCFEFMGVIGKGLYGTVHRAIHISS
jgi:hypothetical protein